ncbi:hypothetical protein Pyn_26188 [Prunus yedoensis var. nudiflora]|uniref:Uncharacterized protein n=1 Tax=Prunus yedoensis var. nudiflora TaxID=2094558 RepID=A0A314ZHB9_PRUYE|nr:hypothetical protein Pyn_26188 [Prunus yedoensis var. nudiflora]
MEFEARDFFDEAIQGYEAVVAEVAASEFVVVCSTTQLNLLIKIVVRIPTVTASKLYSALRNDIRSGNSNPKRIQTWSSKQEIFLMAIQGYEAMVAEVAASEFVVVASTTQLNLLIKIDNEQNWNIAGRLIDFGDMAGEKQKVKMVERATQTGFVEYLRP